MRATLHKLLKIALWPLLLVAVLTGVGMSIASISEEADPLYGFTDQSCSENYKYFNSVAEMDAYSDNPKNNWVYNSYIKYSNPSKCVEVLRVKAVQPTPKKRQLPGSGGGGGGGGGGKPLPPPPATEEPSVPGGQLTKEKLDKLKKCLTDQMDKIIMVDIDSRCVDKLHFEKTSYKWNVSSYSFRKRDSKQLGVTIHHYEKEQEDGSTLKIENSIFLFSKVIENRAGRQDIQSDHLAMQIALDEWAHALQGKLAKANNKNWKNPAPYEWYDLQVQANVHSYEWYKALSKNKTPPLFKYDDLVIFAHMDKNCEHKGPFKKKKEAYQEIEKKEANGTMTADDEQDKEDLTNWFTNNMPENLKTGAYDDSADLGCDD